MVLECVCVCFLCFFIFFSVCLVCFILVCLFTYLFSKKRQKRHKQDCGENLGGNGEIVAKIQYIKLFLKNNS